MAALPPLATVDDLAGWLGEDISDELATVRAGTALRFASAQVRKEARRAWLNDDSTAVVDVPEDIVGIVVAAAGRAWVNPHASQSFTIDDHTERYDNDTVGVELTEGEKETARSYRPNGTSGLWTQPTTKWDDDGDTEWVDVEGGGDPLPLFSKSRPFG